jgi:single-strand DNA-binding protein
MYHKVTIIGNLGKDPEMRYTPSGQQVTSFNVATSEKWTGQDGNAQERTIWWRVSAWGKLAEVCNEYLKKGRQVFVEGSMVVDQKTGQPRIWTGQDGVAHASLEVRALTVKFLGGRGEATAHAEASAATGGADGPMGDEGDIPF